MWCVVCVLCACCVRVVCVLCACCVRVVVVVWLWCGCGVVVVWLWCGCTNIHADCLCQHIRGMNCAGALDGEELFTIAPVPLVSSPILAGGDATDDVTVAFLVAAALEEKDEEEKARVRRQREAAEHEARMRELDRRVQNDVPLTPAESRVWMRWAGHLPPKKRKKRRKRKLPRNSSRPRLAARHLGPLPLPALYALGNLDFLRATGIWHPVRCLSCWRNTGKFRVFWEFTTRNYFYGPLYLAVTCAVYSTTRQSLVPSSPLEYKSMDFSGRRLLVCFPYSVLLGSTVDTCLASVYEAIWLPHCRNCGFSAVAVHRRSSTSSSFRRGRSPWSRLFSRPQRFLRCPFVFRWSMPLFSFPYTAQCLSSVVHVMRQSMECMNFRFFLREKVDLFVASPEEYMIWIFWEITSGCFPFSALLGSTVDTYSASVHGCFWKNLVFLRDSEPGS